MAWDTDTGEEKEVDWQLMSQINLRNKAIKWFWAAGALFLVGCLIIAGSLLFGREESAEPVEVYSAAEEDQYVYARVQYLSPAFVYYETMRDMKFYLALDNELMPSVLCMHQDDLAVLEPYRESYYRWLYGLYDWDDSGKPEEYIVYGYAKPYDEELTGYVGQVLELFAGTELADEEVKELMGHWYVQVGGKQDMFQFFQLAAVFIIGSGFTFLAGAGDFSAWRKFVRELKQPERLQGPVIRADHSIAYGILGALAGALLGAMVWLVVGASSILPAFWVGVVAVFFSYMGYQIGTEKRAVIGILISTVCSVLMLIPAIYLEWCWRYYSRVNTGGFGYIPLSRVMRELPRYLSNSGLWDDVKTELTLGGITVGFGVFLCVCFYASQLQKRNKDGFSSGMR